ncbi:MAG: Sec-independent protein translocase protein TatB [Azoarcus sp.]|jgi:sec-independent protein translocase protein TatB|nr:Sec-independent protein translocase protein TatB [Azoarcus sp.]
MFDLGFSELVVIAVVLLVVVGPERLPKVARTAGHLLGRLQRYVAGVKADIQREMQIDELKKLQEQAREFDKNLRAGVNEIHTEVSEALALPPVAASELPIAASEPVTADAVDAPEAEAVLPAVSDGQLRLDLDVPADKT